MDGRRKKELARLLDDVEATRSSLLVLTAAGNAGPEKSRVRGPRVAFGLTGLVLALIVAAAGIRLWLQSREPSQQERRQRRRRQPVAESQRFASLFATKAAPPAQESQSSQSQVLQIVAKALAELLKPAVTQILTRKATGSLTSLLASAVLKPIFDKRSSH